LGDIEHGAEEEKIDLVDFVTYYKTKNGDEPIMHQIIEAMTFKDPSKIFTFHIDYNTLSPNMKTFILSFNDFNLFSKQFSDAVKTVVFKANRAFHNMITDVNIKVRFNNFLYDSEKNEFPNLISIRSINHEQMNKYICFRGVVRNIIVNQMNIMKQKFKCLSCNNIIDFDFNDIDSSFDGKHCTNIDCKSENLEMQKTIGGVTDIQTLVVEELTHDSADSDASSTNVMVDGDLVNRFNLGDTVIVTGNMRLDVYNDLVVNQFKKKTNDASVYERLSIYGGQTNGLTVNHFIEANYVQKINETNIIFNVFTKEEIEEIERLRTDHHLIDKMVQSFAPDIYGYDMEKEILIYQLVGGNGRSRDPTLDKRGELHVFFIGDAATSKSELMKWSLGIAHKCRKIYAGNMTRAGLTGGADQTAGGGNWVLTAGAAVVADKGLLGIDEFNHAPAESIQPLNEIMEDQTTTITKIKSGSFNTRVSILACANPPDGNRYDKKKTFMENLGINISLFTRFDYIGLFRDIPEPQKDQLIAEKILNSYEKLNIAPISRELLAKYIYYMKNQELVPKFTEEAKNEFYNYYVKIRTIDLNENAKNPDQQEHVSITARQLPTIHRFATARAILLGKEWVDVDDVKRAHKIMDHQLNSMGIDSETGKVDGAILLGYKTTNQISRETVFFELLENMAKSFNNAVNYDYFEDELRKRPQWKKEMVDDKKLASFIQKCQDQQNIIIVNGKISLVNFVDNPNN
jgi:DNA replicative helicase MCM subunit Mcm2 (Cdc46/Mcm family)